MTIEDVAREQIPVVEETVAIERVRRITGVVRAKTETHEDTVIGTTPVQDADRECGEFFKPYTCDVPFGVIVPKGCENLLVGSAKSVCTEPVGIIRGMTGCMICGQAAGVASALAAKDGLPTAEAPVRAVQAELLRQGANLGSAERLKSLGLS